VEPGVLILLTLAALPYFFGLRRLWSRGRIGRGARKWEVACYSAGWFALVVALVSPLHPLGRALFAAHMAQHEILMLIAAPLMILGRPLLVFAAAVPRRVAGATAHGSRTVPWRTVWNLLTRPFVAWLLHGVVLWTWHIPALFDATLDHEWVHALQHSS